MMRRGLGIKKGQGGRAPMLGPWEPGGGGRMGAAYVFSGDLFLAVVVFCVGFVVRGGSGVGHGSVRDAAVSLLASSVRRGARSCVLRFASRPGDAVLTPADVVRSA